MKPFGKPCNPKLIRWCEYGGPCCVDGVMTAANGSTTDYVAPDRTVSKDAVRWTPGSDDDE